MRLYPLVYKGLTSGSRRAFSLGLDGAQLPDPDDRVFLLPLRKLVEQRLHVVPALFLLLCQHLENDDVELRGERGHPAAHRRRRLLEVLVEDRLVARPDEGWT